MIRSMAGRPKKPKHRKMSARIPFVATVAQRESYDRVAEACDLDRSEWIRQTLDAVVRDFDKRAK